jgi:hypothetical protein
MDARDGNDGHMMLFFWNCKNYDSKLTINGQKGMLCCILGWQVMFLAKMLHFILL